MLAAVVCSSGLREAGGETGDNPQSSGQCLPPSVLL